MTQQLEFVLWFSTESKAKEALDKLCWLPDNFPILSCALNGTPKTISVWIYAYDQARIAEILREVKAERITLAAEQTKSSGLGAPPLLHFI